MMTENRATCIEQGETLSRRRRRAGGSGGKPESAEGCPHCPQRCYEVGVVCSSRCMRWRKR
jgi:hypothetical protein